jgi:protein translocase SecG subunit
MQHGKSHGLSGTIAGGAENFFGKEKGKRVDRVLSKLTSAIGVFFVLMVLAIYVIQPDYSLTYKTDNQLPWSVVSPWYNTQTEIGADEEEEATEENGGESGGEENNGGQNN